MDFSLRVQELLAAGSINLFLAGFIFWKYRKRHIARVFSLTTFAFAGYCWMLSGAAGAKDQGLADLWYRYLMPFAYLLVASVFHFCLAFSKTENGKGRISLRAIYGIVAIFTVIRVFNLDNGGMEFRPGQGWFPVANGFYKDVYVPFVLLVTLAGMGLVLNRILRTKIAAERNQMGFFFLAIGGALAFDTMNLVPGLSFLSPFSPVTFSAILAFAVTRHRLFDLSLAVKKGALAAGISFLICSTVVALILKIQDLVIIRQLGFGPFTIISTALLIAVILPLTWDPITLWVNRVLGIHVLSLEQHLLEYSTFLAKHMRFNEYVDAVTHKLASDMGLTKSWVLVKNRVSGGFSGVPGLLESGPELSAQSALLAALAKREQPIDFEELASIGDEEVVDNLDASRRKQMSAELEAMGAAVAVPIRGEMGLEGILFLGAKVSSAIYSNRELDFAQALTMQIASALDSWALHSQVQQAERLSTLGTLSASLAHELRNPLTSISTFVQMMPTRYADESFREKFGRIVGQEISKLTRLTEQLLNFSRPASVTRSTVNLLHLGDRTRQLLRYQFSKKNMELELLGNEEEAFVTGIESELSQVLINLLLNALQASSNGGKVSVQVSLKNSKTILEVKDNGSGMTQEQLGHIFEPFYTTKEEGTGLGLPTCQRILEQHGGSIEVQSTFGEGSVFIMNFPTPQAQAVPVSVAA